MELLSSEGQITDVFLPTDRATGRPRGFAFVEFTTEEDAQKAIEKYNDYELGGRKLRVNLAEDRPPRRARPAHFDPFESSPFGENKPPAGGAGGRPSKPKGSRRGKRAKKRSL